MELRHSFYNEKKNFRNLQFVERDEVEILWCEVHQKPELWINGRLVVLPFGIEINIGNDNKNKKEDKKCHMKRNKPKI
jgi:hypothetical protein